MAGIELSTVGEASRMEDEGQVVHLHDQHGEPLYVDEAKTQPVTVTIAGTYSTRYRKAQEQLAQRLLKKRQRELTPEQITQNREELVASCVLAWTGFFDKGQPLPATKENALLFVRAPWIREQLEEAQADHAGFTGSASRR